MFLGISKDGLGRVGRMVSGASVQFSGTHQRAHLIIYRLDTFKESQHMEGMIGEPVEPPPSYRPCPRALLGRPLAFPFSQSKAAMSSFVERTYKDNKNLNNGALFLVYLS